VRGKRTVRVAALLTAALYPLVSQGQPPAAGTEDPKVDIVQTVGCVEQRSDTDVTWWLTHAADPEVASPGPFEDPQVDDARSQETGSREFHLIGVAEFVDAATLLASGDRALFTTADQVNATNELRQGRFVLVKGLLIDADGNARINLLSVVGLADTCG
jgi:hypothetical protein